jgi:plasmid replication initiation protein
LFCDHNRKEVQNRVGINASQVMTTLAKMWKETLIPDRKIYENGAALLKIEYDKRMVSILSEWSANGARMEAL